MLDIVQQTKLSIAGQVDYVKDGQLYVGANVPSVMVTDALILEELKPIYPPGTIAYTAGFKAMWQLDADGKWVVIL